MEGFRWMICEGHASLVQLQSAYADTRPDAIWGSGSGCWEALWLAEQYNPQLLLLDRFDMRRDKHSLRRAVMRNLFAVVCPVYLHEAEICALANAAVYRADSRIYERIVNKLKENSQIPLSIAKKRV